MARRKAPASNTATLNESKADKFRRLATKRLITALDKIAVIGRLSARGSYDYTAEQVETIANELRGEVEAVVARFAPSAGGSKPLRQITL